MFFLAMVIVESDFVRRHSGNYMYKAVIYIYSLIVGPNVFPLASKKAVQSLSSRGCVETTYPKT